jgi:hypothetical protein
VTQVVCYPGAENPTHPFALSSGKRMGLTVDPGRFTIRPVESNLQTTSGGVNFGDGEPMISHIEQQDWSGGRGQDKFDDKTRFHDSLNAWTLTPNHLHNGLQWKLAKGYRNMDFVLPGSVTWKALTGTLRYMESKFTSSASYNADHAYIWLRKIGSPGTLTLELCSDSAGDPSTVQKTVTVTASGIADVISELKKFSFSSVYATAGAVLHIKVYGASTDTAMNHWEVGVDTTGTASQTSAAGSVWIDAAWTMYYLMQDADTDRMWYFNNFERSLIATDKKASTAASVVYVNGDRGKATSGTSTTIVQSTKAWTADQWIGAYVKILRGTGKDNPPKIITDNDATSLTTATWETTPDNTSEFAIYFTNEFTTTVVGTTGLGKVVSQPVVANGYLYFPQGESVYTRRAYWNAGTFNGTWEADNFYASLMFNGHDAASGPQIWKANNGTTTTTVARAPVVTTNVDATMGTAIPIGSADYPITGGVYGEGAMWFYKEDSMWSVQNDRAALYDDMNIGDSPSPDNGLAAIRHGGYTYFSFLDSLEMKLGSVINDIGAWRGSGMPAGRTGHVAALTSYLGWVIEAYDAGADGTSCVFIWDGIGRHEIFRAWESGRRIREVQMQPCAGSNNNRLWIDCGGDIVYIDFPRHPRPLNNTVCYYQHESVLVQSTIDMNANALPKYFQELSAVCNHLSTVGREVIVEYQLDDEIDGSVWRPASSFVISPEDTMVLNEGDKRKIRIRYRLLTNSSTTPVDINATVLKAFARTPYKEQINFTIRLSTFQTEQTGETEDTNPSEGYEFLHDCAAHARRVRMESVFKEFHGKWVTVLPFTIQPTFVAPPEGDAVLQWGGDFTLSVLVEA